MSNFINSVYQLKSIENIVNKNNSEKINSLSKFIVTIIYILSVISMNKYEISGLLPFIFYPVILLNKSEVPIKLILKMWLFGIPLVIGMGIFNIFLDRRIFIPLGIFSITYGMISFISLFIKGCLTIAAGIALICSVDIESLARALNKFKVPKIFTSQIVFMYRYIFVLMESVCQVNNAYMLRAPYQKGINFKVWGSLLGQLLIRSFDKAQTIYEAMLLRGFQGEYITYENEKFRFIDLAYILIWVIFFLIVKNVNLSRVIGNIVIGRGF